MKLPVGNGSHTVKWAGDGKCTGRMTGTWSTMNSLKVAYGELQKWDEV